MPRAFLRLLLALGGAALASILVALIEARAVTTASKEAGEQVLPPVGALFTSELGLLSPIAALVGGAVGVLAILLQPRAAEGPLRALVTLREGGALERLRAAAAIPIVIFGAFAWTIASAHIARLAMGAGKPSEAGLTIGVGAVGALIVSGAILLAFLPLLRRLLALGSESIPQLLDPALTASIAVIIVGLLFAIGIFLGDTSGADGGVLGILGVLKRPELDLRPLANATLVALGALIAPIAMLRTDAKTPTQGADEHGKARPSHGIARGHSQLPAMIGGGFSLLTQMLLAVLCWSAGGRLGDSPAVVRGVEKHAPLGKIALAVLRKATDHDRDGFSARFAGGDCNDTDKSVNPGALDIPGNGIDEDCSGADTPAVEMPTVAVANADAAAAKPKRTFNVILLTVDTLRPDLGFMGFGKPTSPNLDKVAEKGTVFERAYSMASYTGKSVGPMLIGRYPSEALTDFSHFNTYFDSNVMLAERLRETGVRTFAGMCHWYFRNPTGLKQGFDIWDTSAIPLGMGDNDNVVTSERMGNLALKLLQKPENVIGPLPGGDGTLGDPVVEGGAPAEDGKPHRFFGWFHFFDPHAQYVAHEGSPDFSGPKGPFAATRVLYDQEVWFTDKHIGRVLDYIAAQPWAEDTAIVMTADHGEAFYEHGMLFHGSEIWEELVHVPLFVYVPGAEPRRVSQKRSHIDVVPTILELMGVEPPPDGELRGRSLLQDVYLPKDGEHEERDVFIDMPQGPFNGVKRAVITGPSPGMKLIHSGGSNYQLFDLEADPIERKDLSSDKEKLQAAIARMSAIRGRLKEIDPKPK